MQLHASCAARDGAGVLLIGPPGAGKSDLLLRLIDRGFSLVADDRVDFESGRAAAPEHLAGLLEIRGLGIVRMDHLASASVALVVSLGPAERLPLPEEHLGLPMVRIDPAQASAAARVAAALECVLGRVPMIAGTFE